MSQATKPGTEAADARAGTLHVRAWSEEEFATSREAWERLLRASGADPLFMSWDWQWRWWTHHARALGATLRLVAVYTASDELVGLAPFYSRRVSVRRILRSCRIELIGIAWRDPSAVFSDYLDLIVAPPHCDAVLALIASWLAAQTFWQELVFACIRQDSLASMFVRTHLAGIAYVREVDGLNAWSARLPKQFEDYIAGLTSDARRKLFTHRHRLSHPRLEYADETNIPEFLDLLWCYTT
ncbi:MAG: GNAT family N-acetyltransferase, partial [Steroidobacteraceae bacterium]